MRQPRKPQLSDYERIGGALTAIEESCCRHITQRKLYQQLGAAGALSRALSPPAPEWDTQEFMERGLRRITEAVAARQARTSAVPFAVPSEDHRDQCRPHPH